MTPEKEKALKDEAAEYILHLEFDAKAGTGILQQAYIAGATAEALRNESNAVEKILCAAIWYKEQPTQNFLPDNLNTGVVICGYRHPHCLSAFVALTELRSVEPECGKYVQGFLTSMNRFLNRKEAAQLVKLTGQIKELHFNDEMYSEDLY